MAVSWREPTCPRCRVDFHRIRSGPRRGLGIYTECWRCETARQAQEAAETAAERRRLIVSQSEKHWVALRRRERGEELAEDLGDEGPLPNPAGVDEPLIDETRRLVNAASLSRLAVAADAGKAVRVAFEAALENLDDPEFLATIACDASLLGDPLVVAGRDDDLEKRRDIQTAWHATQAVSNLVRILAWQAEGRAALGSDLRSLREHLDAGLMHQNPPEGGLQDGDRTIDPSPKDGRLVHIVVVRAHVAPGKPWWKAGEHDRPPATELGEIVGTWTNKKWRGDFGATWVWAARSLSTGKIHYIHPMDVRWAQDATWRPLSRGQEETVDFSKNPLVVARHDTPSRRPQHPRNRL